MLWLFLSSIFNSSSSTSGMKFQTFSIEMSNNQKLKSNLQEEKGSARKYFHGCGKFLGLCNSHLWTFFSKALLFKFVEFEKVNLDWIPLNIQIKNMYFSKLKFEIAWGKKSFNHFGSCFCSSGLWSLKYIYFEYFQC